MPRRQVKLSLNDKEYKELAKLAKKSSLPLSTFIKSVVFNQVTPGLEAEFIPEVVPASEENIILLSEVLSEKEVSKDQGDLSGVESEIIENFDGMLSGEVEVPTAAAEVLATSKAPSSLNSKSGANLTLNLDPSAPLNIQINLKN